VSEPAASPSRPLYEASYYLIAAATGALTGVVGSAFHLLSERAAGWPELVRANVSLDGYPLLALLSLVSATMVLLSVLLVRTLAPEAAGSGVQEIEGAMEGLREVRWKRVLPVKFVAGVLALGSGLVLGREGPTIHMGASVSKGVGSLFALEPNDARGLLAAGGAAGLATAFNAPLAAILFVIEETRRQFPYSLRTYSGVIIASITSTIVVESVSGEAPQLLLAVPSIPLSLLPAFLGLGVVLGVLGVVFNWTLVAALELSRRIGLKASPYLVPLVVGAAIGPLLVLRPEATGGGDGLAASLASYDLPLATLAVVVVMRFVMTMASYSAGTPGGIFAPILALATASGLLFATALDQLLPLPPGMLAAFGVAAMGGLFSSTIRAPLVGVVLVAELTGAYAMLLPVIITCIAAHLVANALGGRPIYEVLLERTLRLAGITPPPEPEAPKLAGWDQRGTP